MVDYIEQTFEKAGITPAELKADPSLVGRLVEVGMQVTRGQANRWLLEGELLAEAENAD